MNKIMLDMETMSLETNASIMAIGAVFFDPRTMTLGQEFYTQVSLADAAKVGLHISASTVLWWMDQSQAAQQAFTNNKNAPTVEIALKMFSTWIANNTDEPVEIWGNGAAADNVWLKEAYKAVDLTPPWDYWNDRCYRTVRALHPEIEELAFEGTKHNALADAKHQARHLLNILKETTHE